MPHRLVRLLAFTRGAFRRLDAWASRWLGADRQRERRLATGIGALDRTLGGGLPRGAVTVVRGPPSAGKTTLALRAVAGVQRAGGAAAVVDADGTFSPRRAVALGARPRETLVGRAATVDEAVVMVATLARCGADLVVVDGAWALPGRAARAGRRLARTIRETECAVLLLEPEGRWAKSYCFPTQHARERLTLSGREAGDRSTLEARRLRLE